MPNSKKKSKDLKLPDYKKLLSIVKTMKLTGETADLQDKLKRKIDKLENPPVRQQREKVEFRCKSCDKKFKRAPIICPECSDEDIVRLDNWT